MTKWCQRVGAERLNELLKQTIAVAVKQKHLPVRELQQVTVDTTVQEKIITHPTDSKLLYQAIIKLADAARTRGIRLRQSYLRVGKRAAVKAEAEIEFDSFVEDFELMYPKATECLVKDREVLLTFYDFPAEYWPHLRTTNPIESAFATVRLRHRWTKGNGSRAACLAMAFKLVRSAEWHWRRLNGHQHIPEVIKGIRFIDGIKEQEIAA